MASARGAARAQWAGLGGAAVRRGVADELSRSDLAFGAGRVPVHTVGAGQVVGYLHGFIGNQGGPAFLSQLARAGKCRVVAPSLPGFTGADELHVLRNIYEWVSVTSEIIDNAGLAGQPVIASGISAMLALELASVRPEAFSELVVFAPLGLWDASEPIADPIGVTLNGQRALLTSDLTVTSAFFEDTQGATPEALVEERVSRYIARSAAAGLVWPIPEHGLASRLHRVRIPVTIVWGEQDRFVPPSYAAKFSALLPNVRSIHTVSGAGHLVEWDAPEACAAIVRAALFDEPDGG